MTTKQIIQKLQEEQWNNPLGRYQQVRQHYFNLKRQDWVGLNYQAFRGSLAAQGQEILPFRPETLNCRGCSWMSINPITVLPASVTFLEKQLENYMPTESSIQGLFQWGFQYILPNGLVAPIASLEELENALQKKDFIKSQEVLDLEMILKTVEL